MVSYTWSSLLERRNMDLWRFKILFVLVSMFLVFLVTGEVRTSEFKCGEGKFRCASEKCIPAIWRCDSDDDCGDGSDEVQCVPTTCRPINEFTCGNRKCIPKRWKCDSEKDCADGSDEANCPIPTCGTNFFRCNNSRCVPNRWKCDRQDDCGDKSDEVGCAVSTGTCRNNEYRCTDGVCISRTWLCDGENDCRDGTDENNCSRKLKACNAKTEFRCKNKQCIPTAWRCDGNHDCFDRTDEDNCTHVLKKVCGPLFWRCQNGDCIKKDWHCDGEHDCRDESDEINCKSITCAASKFKCNSKMQCISKALRCNGKKDCFDGSDEERCSTSKIKCGPQDFNCSLHECVGLDKLCDGHQDCLKGEDEAHNCNINECMDSNGHCSHNCTDLKVGYKCSCNKGFKLAKDQRTCTDLDECATYGTCHQGCYNTKGHYKCSCGEGFLLEPDNKTCKAAGLMEWIYFSNRVDIRKLAPNGKDYQIVIDGIRGAVSIDFHIRRKRIFWTDILTDQIQSAHVDGNAVNSSARVVIKHVHTPDGLAVDWINDKLYWTDTGYKTIEVSDLNGDNNMDITDVGLNEPRAISLDPHQGFVYWTDWGSSASIERISMDGENGTREKLVDKNIYWPNGLTLDLIQKKLYWIDAKLHQMEVADLDGNNRMVLKRSGFLHPFAMDNFEDQIYWTDWKSDKLNRMSKFNTDSVNSIKDGLFAPMDIKVYHKSKQPPGKNRCGDDKNGCSNLCLLANHNGVPSAACKCPRGMTLSGTRQCTGTYKPRTGRVDTTPPGRPATTQSTRKEITKKPASGGKGNKPVVVDISTGLNKVTSGNVGAGTIVAILLAILIAIVLFGALLWYIKRRNYGKNHVKYYKDMSSKPLEDDFDIEEDEMGEVTQIAT